MNRELSDAIDRLSEPYRKLEALTNPLRQITEPFERMEALSNPFRHLTESFERMEALSNPFRHLAEPFKKMDALSNPFRQLTEPINEMQRMVNPLSGLGIWDNFTAMNEWSGRLFPLFDNPLLKIMREQEEFHNRIAELFGKIPESLLALATYGWYIDYDSDFTLPMELAKLIEDNDIDKLDAYLINYYSEKLDAIISELCMRHPDRANIFKQIETVHNAGFYYASIPLILAQADGICDDFASKKFFKKDQKNGHLPEITAEIEKDQHLYDKSFLSPLTNQTPIMANEKYLHQYPTALNRHRIIHGTDKEFGTKINSLKCISFVNYLSDILINSKSIRETVA